MVYRIIIYLSCFAPLAGIWLMERGQYGQSINEFGYENGATLAFSFYLLVCFGVVALITKGRFFSFRPHGDTAAIPTASMPADFQRFGVRSLLVTAGFLFFTLFVMGGQAVLSGGMGKGAFRSGLGSWGAIGYLILKYYAPAIFAFACIKFSKSAKSRKDWIVLAGIAFCLIMLAMSWGFKSGGILAVLPGIILVYWHERVWKILLFFLVSAIFLVFAYWFFDSRAGFNIVHAVEFLMLRLTVLQGDVAWKIWDLHVSSFEFPNYSITLLPALGDRIFTELTGISINAPYEWVMTHFGLLLTYLVGYPIKGILDGHNVTGTPFSEGIIAEGFVGMTVFAVIAGGMIGTVYLLLQKFISRQNDKLAAVTACYAVMGLMAWLVGGSIVSLFHVSVLFGLLSSVGLLYCLEYPFKFRT